MNIFSKITAKTMGANRVRTIVTIIGVVLSTSMITAVATFGTSFQRFLVNYSIEHTGNWHVAASGFESDQTKELAEHEDAANAAEIKILGYAWFDPVAERSPDVPYLYVRALSREALDMLPAEMEEGRMPETEDEIAVPAFLMANEDPDRQTKIGDMLTLELGERSYQGERLGQSNPYMGEGFEGNETFTPTGTRTFTVVGIYSSWPDRSYGGAGYDVLAGPTEMETAYQDVFIELKNPRGVYDFAKENLSMEGGSVLYNESLLRWLGIADNSNLTVVMGGLLAILIAVIMAGSITLIYNAFSISLRERTVQFGLLSSIGATKRQLRTAMRYEAFFVSAVGIPLGILAGVGGIGVTLHFIGVGLARWIHGTEKGIQLYVPIWAVAAAAVIAFATIMLSVWIPSRRIRKITPMEAIRSSADIRVRPGEVKSGKWVSAIFGLEGMMASKNYKRDRRKYRATVISLTMSIGLFTAAGLFNMYLLETGAFVLEAPDTDLEYGIYSDVEQNEAEVEAILERTEGIRSVTKHYHGSLFFKASKEWNDREFLDIYIQEFAEEGKTAENADSESGNTGAEPDDAGQNMRNSTDQKGGTQVWLNATMVVLSDRDFERFAKEQKVDVSDYQDSDHVRVIYLNAARQFNPETERYEKKEIFPEGTEGMYQAGYVRYSEESDCDFIEETIEIELSDAAEDVPDSFEEYRNRGVVVFFPESMYQRFRADFPDESLNASYGIQCENPAETYQDLEKKFDEQELLDSGYLVNKREEYETDQNTIIAIKVLTYGFVILISLIAVANVYHTISTNLMLRRKEFAMLRSMGMSPKGFRKMMNYECLIYGIRSMLYGLVITILISAALNRSLGAGADVEFLMPWGYILAAMAGVFTVVFLTMLYTMSVIRKNNIVEELKMN